MSRLQSLLSAAFISEGPFKTFLAEVAAVAGQGGGGPPLSNAAPADVGTAAAPGVSGDASRADHVHDHGDLPGGTLHELVTPDPGGSPGFMSPADKAKLDSISGGGPGISAVWIDATTGNDGTGQRGQIDLPFATIGAALTAAIDGDTLYVSSGTYSENIVMPDKILSIVGSGAATTILENAAPGDTIGWTAGAPVPSFRMVGITVRNDDVSAAAVRFDGSAFVSPSLDVFLRSCVFEDCVIQNTANGTNARFVCCGNVLATQTLFTGSTFTGSTTTLQNTSRFTSNASSFANLTARWEIVPGPFPSSGREGYYLENGSYINGNIEIFGAPIFALSRDSGVAGNVTATGLATYNPPLHSPVIGLNGTIGTPAGGGAVNIVLPTEVFAPIVSLLNLNDGQFYGVVTLSKTGVVRNRPTAAGAFFARSAASSIVAGNLIDLDLRGATYAETAIATTGSGTIGSTPAPLWSQAFQYNTGSLTVINTAGNFTTGSEFHIDGSPGRQCRGIRFVWVGGLGAQVVKVSLYRSGAAAPLASVNVSVNAAGVYEGLFPSPVAIPAGETLIQAAVYNAANYTRVVGLITPSTPYSYAPGLLWRRNINVAGDAKPTNLSVDAYPVEPIMV